MNSRIHDSLKPLEVTPTDTPAQIQVLDGIKHLVFDLYGTLLISGVGEKFSFHMREKILRASLEGHLPDFSLIVHFENLIAQSHAKSRKTGIDFPEVDIRDIWAKFFSTLKLNTPNNLDDFILRYELATNPCWLMPGVEKLLNHPLSRGIISNAQFYTPLIMSRFGFPHLEHTLFSYEHGEAKPGTFLFKTLAQKLNPEETLYLGNDRLKDVAPAATCGFKTALFAGDQRSLRLHSHRKDLPEPDAILTSLSQIPQLLGE